MQGILSLLDAASAAQVREIFAELEQHFGLRGVNLFPYPHVSYCLLNGYTRATVEERLHDIVARFAPIEVHTAGIGIFLNPTPVLFIAVVRSPALERMHQLILNALPPPNGDHGYYDPDQWVPHITLAMGDLTSELLPAVVARLTAHNFHWKVTLDNLTFASGGEEGIAIQCICRLGG